MDKPVLDRLLPAPGLVELDRVDLAAEPAAVYELVRHGDLARSRLIRALFALRTLPGRLAGEAEEVRLRLDDLVSTPGRPGFQVLLDERPREVAVGAIGKVWQGDIPFVHVPDAAAFLAFAEPGYVKVAWTLRVLPRGERDSRLEVEVRVGATDEVSWRLFRRYFRAIGPVSRFIRRSALASYARELGSPSAAENERPLPGDDLLADASEQLTHGIDIAAPPEAIWPWLVQMGCRRAGFYSVDLLDNGGARSACEVHPELQTLLVGEVLPATPGGADGFEVLRIEPARALVLGGLWDADARRQLSFPSPRPERYWQVTWAFCLKPLDEGTTRLLVRARAAFPASGRLHAAWIRPVHAFMEGAQLANLKRRVEGSLRKDDWRMVLEGVGGAGIMASALLTPFLRRGRSRWGLDAGGAARRSPGDELVPEPAWSWTHGIEIETSAAEVWPYVAQIGATRGGFYSYQWLENLAGCELRNAETPHREWEMREGDELRIHPEAPPLHVVTVVPERALVAFAPADEVARAAGKPWVTVSWAFLLEPLGKHRCRFVSRYRCAFAGDLATHLAFGPVLAEPIGFAMDRRMLIGVKERAERAACRREEEAARQAVAG